MEEIDDEVEYQKAFALAERKFRSISHLESERFINGFPRYGSKGLWHGITSQIMRELIAH